MGDSEVAEVDPQEKVIPDKGIKPDIKVESRSGLFFFPVPPEHLLKTLHIVVTAQFDEALRKETEKKRVQKLQLLKLSEEVVTTPVLEMANIWYSPYAKAMICQECNIALIFSESGLKNHFFDLKLNHPDFKLKANKPADFRAFIKNALASLDTLEGMEGESAHVLTSKPTIQAFNPTDLKPVFGIRIEKGWTCGNQGCKRVNLAKIRHNCTTGEKSKEPVKECYIQTLSLSAIKYFQVKPSKKHEHFVFDDDDTAQLTESKPVGILYGSSQAESQASFLHSLQARLDTEMDSIIKQDQTTLNPVFEETGVEAWLSRFEDRSQISSLMPSIPRVMHPLTDKRYKILREVVLWMFAMDMGILGADKSHPGMG